MNPEYSTKFVISPELQSELSIYKYLRWDSDFFLKQWESNIGTYAAGTIRRFNHIFHVQFNRGCSIGKLKELAAAGKKVQLALSFRKHPEHPAYVIIDWKEL